MNNKIIKNDFNFGWKEKIDPIKADLAFKFNRGDILDIGCSKCWLFLYLRSEGWSGKYTGLDKTKEPNYLYPQEVNLIIGDAMSLELPRTDTVILYDILEHIDNPVMLLSRCIKLSKNVLLSVPKRNEELWRYGISEYHQLDKGHRHCGFTREEIYQLSDNSKAKIIQYRELNPIDIKSLIINLFSDVNTNRALNRLLNLIARFYKAKIYYQTIWAELEPLK